MNRLLRVESKNRAQNGSRTRADSNIEMQYSLEGSPAVSRATKVYFSRRSAMSARRTTSSLNVIAYAMNSWPSVIGTAS